MRTRKEEKHAREELAVLQASNESQIMEVYKSHHKCICTLPTGVGKTFIGNKIAQKFSNVIYVAPTIGLIKEVQNNYTWPSGTAFLTYQSIAVNTKKAREAFDDINNTRRLVIFDEAHRMGGEKTNKRLKMIFEENPSMYVLGLTATPYRADRYDVIQDVFNYHKTKTVDPHTVFEKGILPKPYYIHCDFDADTKIEYMKKKMKSKNISDNMIDKFDKICDTFRNSNSYYKNIDEVIGNNTKYVELEKKTKSGLFLIYMSQIKHYDLQNDNLVNAFKKAYPNHKIETLLVASDTYEHHKINLDKYRDLAPKKNTIYLVFSVGMLITGNHNNFTTGVIMIRRTRSDTLYIQIAGRLFSINNNCTGVIFDIVGNSDLTQLFTKEDSNIIKENQGSELEQLDITIVGKETDFDTVERFYRSNIWEAHMDHKIANIKYYKDHYSNAKSREAKVFKSCILKTYNLTEEEFINQLNRIGE